MKIEGDKVTFSTGKVKSANGGVIGLKPDGSVTEGAFYSSKFDVVLTDAECVELADYMINAWMKFKDQHE